MFLWYTYDIYNFPRERVKWMNIHVNIQGQTKEDVLNALQDMAQKLTHQDDLPATYHSTYRYTMKRTTFPTRNLHNDAVVIVQDRYYQLCVQQEKTPIFRYIGDRLYAKYKKLQQITLVHEPVHVRWKDVIYTLVVVADKPCLFFSLQM